MVSGLRHAVELARRQTRAAGQADPVAQYFTALNEGDSHALETFSDPDGTGWLLQEVQVRLPGR